MNFQIKFGVPEFKTFFDDLFFRAKSGMLKKNEIKLFKKLSKTITLLEYNPQHSGLHSHEINTLTIRFSKQIGYKCRVWQSYLENNTPSAGRLYWCYGPQKNCITIIGIEPHPENKKIGYTKIVLSNLPLL